MKKLLTTIILFTSFLVHAEDQWLCVDSGSMKQGNTYAICGVGTASVEGEARKAALNNAINEFYTICNLSSDCKGRKVDVDPKRSTCIEPGQYKLHPTWQSYTCHRLFLFTIQ